MPGMARQDYVGLVRLLTANQWVTPNVQPCLAKQAEALKSNIHRLFYLGIFAAKLESTVGRLQHLGDRATLSVAHKLMLTDEEREECGAEITAELQQLIAQESTTVRTGHNLPWPEASADNIDLYCSSDPQMEEAFGLLMLSLVTSAWTLFESLSGDLWEAALNAYPKLASATGKDVSTKTIHKLTLGKFNLNELMGSALREDDAYSFIRLEGIRTAYFDAFLEHGDNIRAVLSNKSLDALKVVRNVIVHNASVVDKVYVREQRDAPTAPKLAVGERLILNGPQTFNLIDPVVRCSAELLERVDKWITGHKKLDDMRGAT